MNFLWALHAIQKQAISKKEKLNWIFLPNRKVNSWSSFSSQSAQTHPFSFPYSKVFSFPFFLVPHLFYLHIIINLGAYIWFIIMAFSSFKSLLIQQCVFSLVLFPIFLWAALLSPPGWIALSCMLFFWKKRKIITYSTAAESSSFLNNNIIVYQFDMLFLQSLSLCHSPSLSEWVKSIIRITCYTYFL